MNRLVALCTLLLCILGHNSLLHSADSSGQAKSAAAKAWSREQMVALFPAPLSGWTAGDVRIKEYADTTQRVMSAAMGHKPPLNYCLFREYQHGAVKLTLSIWTQERTTQELFDKALDGDQEVMAELAAMGASLTTLHGLPALFSSSKDNNGHVIKIGSGFLMFTCIRVDCTDVTEPYLTRMDLRRITEFVDFPHKREP